MMGCYVWDGLGRGEKSVLDLSPRDLDFPNQSGEWSLLMEVCVCVGGGHLPQMELFRAVKIIILLYLQISTYYVFQSMYITVAFTSPQLLLLLLIHFMYLWTKVKIDIC